MPIMRTTVTLDEDVVRELKARAKRSDRSFKQELNEALRLGFSISRGSVTRRKRFRVRPHHSPFRPGIDAAKLNVLVDQLEVESAVIDILKSR